jgi:hypothetical protein
MPTSKYDEMPARYRLHHTFRDADSLPSQPDPTSVAIAREIVGCQPLNYVGPPTESDRQHLDEEMRLAAAGLTDEERDILAAFDESVS